MNTQERQVALVVEDNWLIREYVSEVLRDGGFAVLPAADGLEAMRLFRQHVREIDLVISDLRMPNMNGGALCRAIHEMRPDRPIIIASGCADGERRRFTAGLPVAAELRKPFEREELLRTAWRSTGICGEFAAAL